MWKNKLGVCSKFTPRCTKANTKYSNPAWWGKKSGIIVTCPPRSLLDPAYHAPRNTSKTANHGKATFR